MRQPLVLAFVAFTSLGLAACATPNPIQTDRTVFNFDSTFQRAAYGQPIETTFDKTVTVFREAGYALDIIDRATGQISGQRGKTGDKGASKNNDMRFVALVLPGVGGGSQLALKFVQVSNVGVPVITGHRPKWFCLSQNYTLMYFAGLMTQTESWKHPQRL